jgi:hypothetical protein
LPIHVSCTLNIHSSSLFTFSWYTKLRKLLATQTVLLCTIHGVCWGPRHIHAVSYWGGSVQPMNRGGSTLVANENTAVRRWARDHPHGVHVYKSWLGPAWTVIMTSRGPCHDVIIVVSASLRLDIWVYFLCALVASLCCMHLNADVVLSTDSPNNAAVSLSRFLCKLVLVVHVTH